MRGLSGHLGLEVVDYQETLARLFMFILPPGRAPVQSRPGDVI